jgi:tRNA-specific 2-thiouridylase
MTKADVRAFAAQQGLSTADRLDSQDFYSGDKNELVGEADRAGDIVDISGRVLGKHFGFWHYTVGQRRGLGVAAGQRVFITEINPETNTITLAEKGKGLKNSFYISDLVFSGMKKQEKGSVRLYVKTRYLAPLSLVDVEFEGDVAHVHFVDEPKLVTPGQSAVFYDGDLLALGGFID